MKPKSNISHHRALPLSGIRVLDLTRILSGPFCTMKLGDMGAEVIKIEQPGKGDDTRGWGPPFIKGESAYFLSVNRNKKSVTVDLKAKEGKAIIRSLIKRSDVLVENFRAGVMEKLGFGYEDVRRLNPRLVYCSISGYGHTSSRSHRPSYDLIVQGESGLMDLTGFPQGPPTKVGVSLADVTAGTLAFEGIILALLQRVETRKGQFVDISLLDGILSLFAYQSQIALSSKLKVTRKGNEHPTIIPYETFQTKNGYVNVAVGSEGVWRSFCRAIEKEELSSHPRFATNAKRVENREALKKILVPLMLRKRSSQWIKILGAEDVPVGVITDVRNALMLDAVQERKMILELHHPKAGKLRSVGSPIKLSYSKSTKQLPPPLVGQHTVEILRGLGYSQTSIEILRSRGIV